MTSLIKREWYTIAIFGMLVLAAILPISGEPARAFSVGTKIAVMLLFFLHGARLSREVVLAGMIHWRLHLFVLATTFVVFPMLGLIIVAFPSFATSALGTGIMFLCILPSTVQSSIAFTSIAGGNVPAAICSASASNILGMFLTPLLVGLLFHTQGSGGISLDAVQSILLQLLAPFVLGQLVQPFIGRWLGRHRALTQVVDRGSILMVIYGAFSEATISGLWQRLSLGDLTAIILIDTALLIAVLCFTYFGSGWLRFNREDQIAITFCGSKKSLASGAPMASVIFAGQNIGSIVLPLMLFHQIQLMACAILARREAMISMLIEDMVSDLGCLVVGPTARLDHALTLALQAEFDMAVLDINVDGSVVYPVADVLRFRRIPFIFATGYDFRTLPQRFKASRVLSKPFTYESFSDALREAFVGASIPPAVV